MEGSFSVEKLSKDVGVKEKIEGVIEKTKEYKICSLSRDLNNPLLWGYYAGGFNGFAIELDFELVENKVDEVKYRDDIYKDISNKMLEGYTVDEISRKILFSKRDVWKHEKEVRILNDSEFYDVNVTKVIAGNRLDNSVSENVKNLCECEKIGFYKVCGINDLGNVKLLEILNFTDSCT